MIRKESREGFSIDPQTGQKEDETIHGPILTGLSPQAEKQQRRGAKARAKSKHGLDDETTNALYGYTGNR
jgi:hypothetical protein